jgi:hypothetical protein
MSYSDFKTLEDTVNQFDLHLSVSSQAFAIIPPVAPSDRLRQNLEAELDWSIQVGTEIARREGIVHPIFMEVRQRANVAVFSGREFNVDANQGLNGYCDYIVSLNPLQAIITVPVIIMVEAKKNDLDAGTGQCVAGMVGAWQFNQNRHFSLSWIYGVVTTGTLWRFMRLQQTNLEIDFTEYPIPPVDRVLGILLKLAEPQT